jgi:hypothetical protein
MDGVWKFLEMDAPNHDFTNVEQVTTEDDSVHGLDLHTIRQEVKPVVDDSLQILGKDFHTTLQNAEFWRP